MQADGTPDPNHPVPLPLRLWIKPDGALEYEMRSADLEVAYLALDLAVAWGTTGAANDWVVLDILKVALGLALDLALENSLRELGVRLGDSGRVTALEWYCSHPYEYFRSKLDRYQARGIHPLALRKLGQMERLALSGNQRRRSRSFPLIAVGKAPNGIFVCGLGHWVGGSIHFRVQGGSGSGVGCSPHRRPSVAAVQQPLGLEQAQLKHAQGPVPGYGGHQGRLAHLAGCQVAQEGSGQDPNQGLGAQAGYAS